MCRREGSEVYKIHRQRITCSRDSFPKNAGSGFTAGAKSAGKNFFFSGIVGIAANRNRWPFLGKGEGKLMYTPFKVDNHLRGYVLEPVVSSKHAVGRHQTLLVIKIRGKTPKIHLRGKKISPDPTCRALRVPT